MRTSDRETPAIRVALLAGILVVAAAPGGAGEFEWPMIAGNAGWTGFSPDQRVKPPFRLKWVHKTDGCIKATVTVAAGRAFAAVQQGPLVCLDAETGRLLWENGYGGSVDSVSSDGKRVYNGRRGVRAMDAATGKVIWSAGSPIVAAWRRAPVFKDDIVYWGLREGQDNYVAAFKAEDGKLVWKSKVGGEKCYISAPCLGSGLVLVTTKVGEEAGAAVALDQKTGEEKWRVAGLSAKRAISTDGKHAWVADTNPGVTALEIKTGRELWHWGGAAKARKPFYTRELTSHNPPLAAYGRLFVKAYFGFFNVLDPQSGKVEWFFDDGAGTGCAMPSAASGYLFFGTGNYNPKTKGGRLIHAIDAGTHKSVWSYRTGGRVCSQPAIAYGRLYVAGNDGRVYCFEPCPEDYRPPAPQPPPAAPAAPPKPLAEKFDGQPGAAGEGEKPAGGKDWPMYGGCPARCGLELELGLPVRPAWELATGGRVRSSPVICGGIAYVGSDSGKLFAIDLATGREKWKAEIGARVRSAPAVAPSTSSGRGGGLVICGADDGVVRAYDAQAGGAPKWEFRTGGPVAASPAIVGERVVFGSHDHHCYCVRLSDGGEFWRFKANHEIHAPPAVAHGTVYVGTWMWELHALDLGTGRPLPDFQSSQGGGGRGYPITGCGRVEGVAVYRGMVATCNSQDEQSGKAYVLDANSGKLLASAGSGYTYGAPAFGGSRMFVPAAWNGVPVLDLATRKFLTGRAQLRDAVLETPLVTGNMMVAATRSGEIKALTLTDGKEQAKVLWQWKSPGGERLFTAPAAAGGFILVGSDDGRLYAFSYGDGAPGD
jgi:outer membrane protein assembly factor BamB